MNITQSAYGAIITFLCLTGTGDISHSSESQQPRSGFTDNTFKNTVIKALGTRKVSPANDLTVGDPLHLIGNLRIDPQSGNLQNLDGIEQLSGLTNLTIYGQDITGQLDLTGLSNLVQVNCGVTALRSLKLSNNHRLRYIQCRDNGLLTELSLPCSTNLVLLDCAGTSLTRLDVSQYKRLQVLACSSALLTNINVAECLDLNYLTCYGNELASLDLTNCHELVSLRCSYNQLKGTLDLSCNTNLVCVDVESNRLSEIVIADTNRPPKEFKYDAGTVIRDRRRRQPAIGGTKGQAL